MNPLKNLILVLVVLLLPSLSFAQDPAPTFTPYYGVGVGMALLNQDIYDRDVRESYRNTKALEASAFYRFHPNFAVEADFESLRHLGGTYTGSLSDPNGGYEQEYSCHPSQNSLYSRVEARGFLAALNLRYYPGSLFGTEPYLMAGAGMMKLNSVLKEITTTTEQKGWGEYAYTNTNVDVRRFSSHTETVFAGQVGVGISIPLCSRAALEIEGSYKLPTQELREFKFYSASARLVLNF